MTTYEKYSAPVPRETWDLLKDYDRPDFHPDDRDTDATEDRLWANYRWMQVVEQLGQFVCNRYPLNSTIRKNGPSNTMSNVPTPTKPGNRHT